ncbi:MAG: PH domain-containing protein [Candidatus Humimicrobiaceae bacterium]
MGLKPSPMLKKLWYIVWLLWLLIGIIIFIGLTVFLDILIFSISMGVFLALMAAVLAWIPKAYREVEYFIEDGSVKMRWGVVWKKQVTVPYKKITNVDITQGPMERFLGTGTLHLQTAGAGGKEGTKAELKLPGIKNLGETRDLIVGKLEAKKSAGKEELPQGNTLAEILEELRQIHLLLQK